MHCAFDQAIALQQTQVLREHLVADALDLVAQFGEAQRAVAQRFDDQQRPLGQVAVASGSKMVFVAGQVAWDADGVTVGEGDLAAQVEQCYLNVGTALAGAGGSFDDVAKLTVYVVDWTPDKMPLLLDGISRAAAKLAVTLAPPATLVGVAAPDTPEHLVEIEATAILD